MPVLPEPVSQSPLNGDVEPWATAADVCAPCTEETEGLVDWLLIASDLLYQLSGQRFPGVIEDTVRPCAARCHGDGARRYDTLDTALPGWYGACGCDSSPCGCTTLSELWLTGWPLLGIEEILIDGDVLDPTLYRVDNWARLVRLRDPGSTSPDAWPACQDLDLPTTEPDTFQVTFTYGKAPPAAGMKAAASLGCQLALACAGSGDCRLPQRVQSITRQGVSMVLLDPFTFFDDGRTGLYDVDLFLAAYGPTSKKRWPAVIVNPDTRARARRVTG